ncbi:MAG: DUF1127 domain-containing protein [Paracoccaceae bacterium]|nr:DUF1127 domain-containing protein [Paracoccaceae bacterium]MDE3120943.1 DUF1127 domain-containing protein [Paracoccaceae bacterium]
MAYANTSVRHTGFGFRDRVAALVRVFNEGVARRRVYRKTFDELSALSDRDLADLGIHRSLIAQVALDAANGK